jgi:hypothetical protein
VPSALVAVVFDDELVAEDFDDFPLNRDRSVVGHPCDRRWLQ